MQSAEVRAGTEPAVSLRLLIVDDEAYVRDICGQVATDLGYECRAAENGREAAELVDEQPFDIVLTDVRMPERSGFELLRHIRERSPETSVAMMTGYGTIEQAVEAMRLGVYDYITKPFDLTRVASLLKEMEAWRREKGPSRLARYLSVDDESFHGLVGRSPCMKKVFEQIVRAAGVDYTVLIQGESGTGKELVAQAIHQCSARAAGPFLPVECGALSETLIESELFGHVKGSFTGAQDASPGILRAAKRGSVFLDEIGELPAGIQPKFLRALQEKEARPVGGTKPEPFDARMIAATNRDLQEEVGKGTFRQDLFYRLHVIPIYVPPLRERREDIPLLIDVLLKQCADASGRPLGISQEAIRVLADHDWPGNVRELKHCLEQASVMKEGRMIEVQDLPATVRAESVVHDAPSPTAGPIKPLADREAEAIREVLETTGYNKTQAAKALGISLRTLYAKIEKYEIPAQPNPE